MEWKKRSNKTPYQYNEYNSGGTKAMNLSLKASLIPKLYFNKEWFSSRLLEKAHPMFEKKLFPFLQVQPSQFFVMKGIFSELSAFLTEALQSWLHFQFHPPENNDHILQQMLWLNSGTLSGGATIFSEQMFLKGVMIVKDIIHEEGGIMSYSQLTQRHGRVCTLQQYNQLTGSLPQRWKIKFCINLVHANTSEIKQFSIP